MERMKFHEKGLYSMEGKRFALIPAYEPDHHLSELCAELKQRGYVLVIVNDGSSGRCAEYFRQAAAYGAVLEHVDNLGKGAAIKTGLRHFASVASEGDVVVTADADGQHHADDIDLVAGAAQFMRDALVIGSRTFDGEVPLRSRVGNHLARLIFLLSTHRRMRDTQSGLRAFSVARIPELLKIGGQRYEYEMNVLLSCARSGVPIVEVPIRTIYLDENASSHFHAFRDAWSVCRELLRFAFSSLTCFGIDYALFALLSGALSGFGRTSIPISNVLARVVSACANYALNRRFVFACDQKVSRTLPRYLLLAAGVLAANTALLTLLTAHLRMNRYLAKLLTEGALFFVSWLVQHAFVFRDKNRSSDRP